MTTLARVALDITAALFVAVALLIGLLEWFDILTPY